jgi:hypothetical protein
MDGVEHSIIGAYPGHRLGEIRDGHLLHHGVYEGNLQSSLFEHGHDVGEIDGVLQILVHSLVRPTYV